MNQLTKAQITVGLLAVFALIWGLLQEALKSDSYTTAIIFIIAQMAAIIVLAFIILFLLEWVKVFDLKTNAILTLLVLVSIRLLSETGLF
jgi:hypothetical protein